MSDSHKLDGDLRGLRDELSAAIPLPDVALVTGRARTRRRTQIGAIVAVIVVALAVPVLRGLNTNTRPATQSPSNTSYVLDFADRDHAYALARACPQGVSGCTFTLYRSADGGRTWGKRSLPAAPDPKTGYFNATMYVLGPDAVVLDRPHGQDSDRIYSDDGGRTWHRTGMFESGNATAPLAGGAAPVVAGCSDQPLGSTNVCTALGTIRADTGAFVATPAQPPLLPSQIGLVATTRDRYWVIGRDATSSAYALGLTADGGRTWSTTDLPVHQTFVPDPVGWSVAEHDGVLYVMATSSGALAGVWRGHEGSMPLVWAPSTFRHDNVPGLVGNPVVTKDGGLLTSDGRRVWHSTDQGNTFTAVNAAPFSVKWTRGGYVRMTGDRFALSTDGRSWREFQVR